MGKLTTTAAILMSAAIALSPMAAQADEDRGEFLDRGKMMTSFYVGVGNAVEAAGGDPGRASIFAGAALGNLREALGDETFGGSLQGGKMAYPSNRVPNELAAFFVVPPADMAEIPIKGCVDQNQKIVWMGELDPQKDMAVTYASLPDVPDVEGFSPCRVFAHIEGKKLAQKVKEARR